MVTKRKNLQYLYWLVFIWNSSMLIEIPSWLSDERIKYELTYCKKKQHITKTSNVTNPIFFFLKGIDLIWNSWIFSSIYSLCWDVLAWASSKLERELNSQRRFLFDWSIVQDSFKYQENGMIWIKLDPHEPHCYLFNLIASSKWPNSSNTIIFFSRPILWDLKCIFYVDWYRFWNEIKLSEFYCFLINGITFFELTHSLTIT